MTAGTDQLRRANTALVVRRLREDGAATRAELAVRTGLAKATVGVIVGALEAAKLPELARPSLGDGEGWQQLLEWELPDPEALASRGGAFERLDQLALEHLYGVR